MSREHIETAVDALHLGRRVMDGWDIGPDRDELKYEVRPFRARTDTYADLGIILQDIYFPRPNLQTTTPTSIPHDLSFSPLDRNSSSFPPTTSYISTSSPMATFTSSREEAGSQKKKKKTGGKSTNVSLPPTASQPSSSTRGREEDGTKQKGHATKSSIPRTVVFFATKQQCMDARDALRSIWPDSPDQVDTFHGSTSPE
ncbi:hypothetical protein I312_106331 [Cryptococcus bacillisporus CA1280]|uniref:uncharacterized protein n=1 Tax=Cryptococcus bacillisporus CA1280 TaxID=1296109 RepID=UPI003369357E